MGYRVITERLGMIEESMTDNDNDNGNIIIGKGCVNVNRGSNFFMVNT